MENKKIAYVLLGSALVLSGIILYRRNGRLTALNSDGYPLKINTKKIVWDNGIMPSGVYDNGIQKYSVSIITDTNAATSGHANITYNLLISGIVGGSGYSYDYQGNIKDKLPNNTLPPVVNENDATKAGMPYSIDLSKITVDKNQNVIYPLLVDGESMYFDKENNKIIVEVSDEKTQTFLQANYDVNTGMFLNLSKISFNGEPIPIEQPIGSHDGAKWIEDNMFGTGGYWLYPDGTAIAANGMPLGNIYMSDMTGEA